MHGLGFRNRLAASVSQDGRQTLGKDEERERRSRLLLLDERRSPQPSLGAPFAAGLDKLSSRGAAAGRALDLVGVLVGGAVAEVSLSASEVVVGALPVRALSRVGRG